LFLEITWLGRGGLGAVTAAYLIAKAAVKEGLYAQSMPFFTAERRGAPVYAYTRLSDKPIKVLHYIKNPDILIVFDVRLPVFERMVKTIKPNGMLIVNATEELLREHLNIDKTNFKIAIVDATRIATDLGLSAGGLALVNTAMLGAFSKVLGKPKLETFIEVFKATWREEIARKNIEAVKRGYDETRIIKG